jgi:excisionase family DNA binding protein
MATRVLLSVNDLEELTGVSRFTWRSYISRGDIPVVRIGRRVLVAETDLNDFIKRHRIPGRNGSRGVGPNSNGSPG